MKIMPVIANYSRLTLNKKNNYNQNFRGFEAADVFSLSKKAPSTERESAAKKVLSKGKNVLSAVDGINEIAKRKYREARKIQKEWLFEKTRFKIDTKNQTIKEYLTAVGGLSMYAEERRDGSRRIIQYLDTEPIGISEIDKDGKTDEYYFAAGNLMKVIQGKTEEVQKLQRTTTIPREFRFSVNGSLSLYRENCKIDETYGKGEKETSAIESAGCIMEFCDSKNTYLKKAKVGLLTVSENVASIEDEFEFDKQGNLIN